jgi:hypothetical protein
MGKPSRQGRIMRPIVRGETQMAKVRKTSPGQPPWQQSDERALGKLSNVVMSDGGRASGYKAGAEGLHFLNFRSHTDNSFHLPGRREYADTGITA